MLIGVAGRKRSGKDTLGAALVERYGFTSVAFADGVREFVAAAFCWPLNYVHGDDFKAVAVLYNKLLIPAGVKEPNESCGTPITGRELLQRVGTEAARRVFGNDCWVKVALAKCAEHDTETRCAFNRYGDSQCNFSALGHDDTVLEFDEEEHEFKPGKPKNYVITDVRFQNELKAIKAAGGKVIRLNRADREHRHDFQPQGISWPDCERCDYGAYSEQNSSWGAQKCELPPLAHPSHFSVTNSRPPGAPSEAEVPKWLERHPSETSLPDASNLSTHYDFETTGEIEENTKRALQAVADWLK